MVAALADAVRRLVTDPEAAPDPAELAGLLEDAGAEGSTAPDGGASREANARAPGPLTRREREVLVLAERGMTNREIGEALYISENTVRKHLKGANRTLGTRTKAEAVHAARVLGVL